MWQPKSANNNIYTNKQIRIYYTYDFNDDKPINIKETTGTLISITKPKNSPIYSVIFKNDLQQHNHTICSNLITRVDVKIDEITDSINKNLKNFINTDCIGIIHTFCDNYITI